MTKRDDNDRYDVERTRTTGSNCLVGIIFKHHIKTVNQFLEEVWELGYWECKISIQGFIHHPKDLNS